MRCQACGEPLTGDVRYHGGCCPHDNVEGQGVGSGFCHGCHRHVYAETEVGHDVDEDGARIMVETFFWAAV